MNLIKKTLKLMGSSNRKRKRQKRNKKVTQVQKVTTKKTVDIGINTDKQLKDYKIFVFDLDNTLYLHKVESKIYNKKLENFLVYLKDQDKKLYIATHNLDPVFLLDKLNITHLFDGIIKETKDVSPWLNSIMEYTSKKDMILEILKDTDFTTDDVIFFDDHEYNITQVNSICVKSIYVNDLKGINFMDIY